MPASLKKYELMDASGFMAVWWQSLSGGSVPARSILTVLQRLGMIIERLGPFAGKNMRLHKQLSWCWL